MGPGGSVSLEQRYEVVGELGRGGMGVVYDARERATGREVVIKVLLTDEAEGSEGDGSRHQRFLREGRLLASLNRPGLVRVHGSGLLDGRPALVLEKISGCDLRSLVRDRGPAPGEDARPGLQAERFAALVDALAACHEAGIVHRDIKPDNILVDRDGAFILCDFGLARGESGGTAESLTMTGQVLGTPAYMAPEQFIGGDAARRPEVDIWALGLTWLFLWTGRNPISSGSMTEVMARILSGNVGLKEVAGELPPRVVDIAAACLRTEAGDRPSASELLDWLCGRVDPPPSELGSGRGARRLRFVLIPALITVAVLTGLAVVALGLDRTPPTLELGEATVSGATGEATIVGRVIDEAPAGVLLRGPGGLRARARCDEAGTFTLSVRLRVGDNALSLVAADEGGRLSAPATLTLTLDREPPTVRLDELPPESFEEVLRLAIVSDEAGVWRLGDATGELKPGRSTIPWPLSPGPNRASLVLEDRAGNRRELALRCLRMPSLRATPETFKVVLTNIPNGGRVVLAAGDYREFNLSRRRLTIVAETPGAVSVLGGDLRALDGVRSELALEGLSFAWEGRDPHKPLVEFRESKVRLRGCRFSSKRRPALFASGASAELTVADCDFHSLDAAIRVVDGGRATVTDSRFKGAGMALSVVTGSSFSGARLVFDGPGVGVITERSAAELRDIEARSTVRVLLRCEGRATLKLRSTTLVARDAGHVGLHLSGGRAVLEQVALSGFKLTAVRVNSGGVLTATGLSVKDSAQGVAFWRSGRGEVRDGEFGPKVKVGLRAEAGARVEYSGCRMVEGGTLTAGKGMMTKRER